MEQKEKNLVVCSLAHGYNHGVNSLHSIAIPLLVSYFALSYSAAGMMSTLFFIAYALMSYPAGKYSTYFGRKNLIIFYLVVGAVVCGWRGLGTPGVFCISTRGLVVPVLTTNSTNVLTLTAGPVSFAFEGIV